MLCPHSLAAGDEGRACLPARGYSQREGWRPGHMGPSRGGGVDIENDRPRRPWPDCEGWAPQAAADIRCTRIDGSHAVGVRWSSWLTADAVVVVLGTVWDDLPRQALWAAICFGRGIWLCDARAPGQELATARHPRFHGLHSGLVGSCVVWRPFTSCCGRCCSWCSATGVPVPAADEEETDATPDEGDLDAAALNPGGCDAGHSLFGLLAHS